MKLISKKPYIDYLIVKLHERFIVQVGTEDLIIKRKRKWYQKDRNFKLICCPQCQEERVIDMLIALLEMEEIDYWDYKRWERYCFSNEIELY